MDKKYLFGLVLLAILCAPISSHANQSEQTDNFWNSALVSIEQSLQGILDSLSSYLNVSATVITSQVSVEDAAKENFYKNLFKCALDRYPNPDGLKKIVATSDNKTFEAVYMGIFSSAEYIAKKKTDQEFVNDMYRCILNRQGEVSGVTSWINRLNKGTSRTKLVSFFVNSVEFKTKTGLKLAESLGYSLTNTIAIYTPSVQYEKNRFHNELYRCILGRDAEAEGRSTWKDTASSTSLDTFYTRIFNSQEYIKKKTSNETFVADLYKCILDRPSDSKGLTSWVYNLETGWTRPGLVSEFLSSKEFQTGRGELFSQKTGYQLNTVKPYGGSWPQWRDIAKPFEAGIPVTTTTIAPVTNCIGGVQATSPLLGDFWITRQYTNGCKTTWHLIGSKVTWSKNGLEVKQVNTVFNPGPNGTQIGDGNIVTHAYDPTAMDYGSTTWIVFECTGKNFVASACMGPLKSDKTLDTSRTYLIIDGTNRNPSEKYNHSASVPKLLKFKGKIYMYWTDVQRNKDVSWGTNYVDNGNYLVTKGIEIIYDKTANKFYPIDSKGVIIKEIFYAFDKRSVIVFDRNLKSLSSNRVADLNSVTTDGTYIYGVGAVGGGDCLTPLSPAEGCYRNYISRTTKPLDYNTFGKESIPDKYLPPLYQAYLRLVYRPDTDSTWLVGGRFIVQREKYLNAGLAVPNAEPAGSWAYPWPENIMKPQ